MSGMKKRLKTRRILRDYWVFFLKNSSKFVPLGL
jgi:hypothetical protein